MTLNITLLTERATYQSADFRLTNADTGAIITDASTKLVTLKYFEWDGFVTYTGVGRWRRRDIAGWIVEWLTGLEDASPQDVAQRIEERATGLLNEIVRSTRLRHRHTFALAAFWQDRPHIWVISNFENCAGMSSPRPSSEFSIDQKRLTATPIVVVTGQKQAVSRQVRQWLVHLARRYPDDSGRIRRRLIEINEDAAESPLSGGTVSSGCSVCSFRADGTGFQDMSEAGDVHPIVLTNGVAMPSIRELRQMIGFSGGQIRGMTFGSSKPAVPHAPCQPHTVTPDDSVGYWLSELTHPEFETATARDVNDNGIVVGLGTRPGQRGDQLATVWGADASATLLGFIGNVGALNDEYQVAGTAKMDDGSEHAVRWSGAARTDLGCHLGKDSGGIAINTSGLVAGWVCVNPEDRGQANFRPAAWFPGQDAIVLDDFGCGWGQAVDVNDEGAVLLVGYVGFTCRALLWRPISGDYKIVGGDAAQGVYPMGLTNTGMILGFGRDKNGDAVAGLASDAGDWEPLGTPASWYPTAINDEGDVVGSVLVDGYERPWLRHSSGEVIWLPYFDYHYCRPSAVSHDGVVVGQAQTDHGTHALMWRASPKSLEHDDGLVKLVDAGGV
jgi:hypothetical protein